MLRPCWFFPESDRRANGAWALTNGPACGGLLGRPWLANPPASTDACLDPAPAGGACLSQACLHGEAVCAVSAAGSGIERFKLG